MLPKLLVLEGPDCSGKTTLGRSIQRFVPHSIYWHLTSTPALNEAMYDYQKEAINNLIQIVENGQLVILDRYWPSEYVYSKVFRPQHHQRAIEHWQEFHNYIIGIDGRYIFCDDSEVVERHSEQQDPAHPYDAHAFAQVIMGYRDLFDNMVHEDYVIRYNMLVHGANIPGFLDSIA